MTTHVALRLQEAGLERRRLSEVAAETDDDDVRSSRRASVDSTAMLPSVEPSSTKITSNGCSCDSSDVRDLVVERLERVLLVEQWDDDGDQRTEGIGLPGRHLQPGIVG